MIRSVPIALVLALCAACPPAPQPPPPPPPTSADAGAATANVPPGTGPGSASGVAPVATEPPATTTVAIVGGGVAGLVTAYELKKKGVAFHLLEASDQLGGRVQTAHYDGGLRAEYGLQEVWADNPLYAIMQELKLPLDGGPEPAYSSMVLDGKMYPFVQDTNDEYFASMMKPEEIKQLKAWMAKATELRAIAMKDGVKNAQIAKLQDMTFKAWIESFKMSKRVNDWIRLTLECELAHSWDVFSAAVGLLEFGVFLGEGEPNYKVAGGNTKLIEALAASAGLANITKSAMVQRVDRPKGGGAVVSYLQGGKVKTLKADYVVVAVPPWRLHQINFEPTLSKKKWEGVTTLMRGSYTVVHMIVNKDHRKITYVNGENPFPVLSDGVTGVIYGAQSEAPAESPNEVFAFLVHGGAAYGFHMLPREAKIKEMLDGMDKLWPGFSKYVVTTYVYTYHPGSITVWPAGRSPIDDESDALRAPDGNLYLVGDWLWSGHSDGAARSGMNAAASIATAVGAKK